MSFSPWSGNDPTTQTFGSQSLGGRIKCYHGEKIKG